MDGQSPTTIAVARCRVVAEPVNPVRNSSKRVVHRPFYWQPDLRGEVRLPSRRLPVERVVLVACRKPRDVRHVQGNEPRGCYHPVVCVVVPSSGRAVGLGLGNLVAAVPRRGRYLPGEAFASDALAL